MKKRRSALPQISAPKSSSASGRYLLLPGLIYRRARGGRRRIGEVAMNTDGRLTKEIEVAGGWIMNARLAEYQKFIDALVHIRPCVLPRWIKGKGWPQSP